MSLNKVMLIGFVGTDPEVRVLSSGNKVANLTLATTERGYTTQSGQTVPDRTEWHSLTVWGKGADVIEKYVRKGSQIYVEGKIKTRSWTDDGGVTRYKTEIQVDIFEPSIERIQTTDPTKGREILSGIRSETTIYLTKTF